MLRLFGRELVAGRGLEVRAEAVETGPAEILIYDVIGRYYDWQTSETRGVDGKEILETIAKLAGRPIGVRINSPGGLVDEGIAIYNALRRHDGEVTTTIDGAAHSIAAVIAVGGREVRMAESATFMIHAASVLAVGNARDFRRIVSALEALDESIGATFVRKTGKTPDEIATLMADETWMSATEALEAGFVDQVLDGNDVVATKISPEAIRALRAEDVERLTVEGVAEELLRQKTEAEARAAAEEKARSEASAIEEATSRQRFREIRLRILEAENHC